MKLEIHRSLPKMVVLDLPFGNIFTRSTIIKGDDVIAVIDSGIKDSYEYIRDIVLEESTKQDVLSVLLINTHEHYDHIGSNYSLQQKFSCLSLAHIESAPYMRDHIAQFYQLLGKFPEAWKFTQEDIVNFLSKMDEKTSPSVSFSGNLILDLGDRSLEVIEVPGHTKGSCAVWDNVNEILVTGDAIGWRGVNNALPQYEDVDLYISSIEKMMNLEASYLISGHFAIIEGKKEVKDFEEQSISYVYKIDGLVKEGVKKKLSNLREIAEYVCRNLEANLTPQGLITINAHLSRLKKEEF